MRTYVNLAVARKTREQANNLALSAMAARGEPKAVKEEFERLMSMKD